MALNEIQTVVRDVNGREVMGFSRTRKPTSQRDRVVEITIGGPDPPRSWVMTVGEAVDVKQQLTKALWHLGSKHQLPKKKAPNDCEEMDET